MGNSDNTLALIKKLPSTHKRQIIDYCMQNEQENLFILGSFNLYKNPFERNLYFGYFEGKTLKGIAVYFRTHKSLVIHALKKEIINKFVDYIVEKQIHFTDLPVFKKYGEIILKQLKKHDIKPKKVIYEYVMILEEKNFNYFGTGEERQAKESDREDIAAINVFFSEKKRKMSKDELDKVIPETTFILREGKKVVSKANLHGYSENFFQIGGMITHPKYRNKGYAKQVLSALCKHYFDKGIKYALLFTAEDNLVAQKVYKKLGFEVKDEFIIARF